MRMPKHLQNPNPNRNAIGAPAQRPRNQRLIYFGDSISLWGWPSRGGLIVLERATAPDFDYVGLERLNLDEPLYRDSRQEEEDAFCQRLLRLGARWFDSRERYGFIANVADYGDEDDAIENGIRPAPSDMERRWISVGISHDGFWVLEYDRVIHFAREMDNLLPSNAAQVTLATTMEERCQVLKRLGAAFYSDLSEYQGLACLNAWATKTKGEFGPLKTAVPR